MEEIHLPSSNAVVAQCRLFNSGVWIERTGLPPGLPLPFFVRFRRSARLSEMKPTFPGWSRHYGPNDSSNLRYHNFGKGIHIIPAVPQGKRIL